MKRTPISDDIDFSDTIPDFEPEDIFTDIEQNTEDIWKTAHESLLTFHTKQLENLLQEQQQQYNLFLEKHKEHQLLEFQKSQQFQKNILITEERRGNTITVDSLTIEISKQINDFFAKGNKQFGIFIWSKGKFRAYAIRVENIVAKPEDNILLDGVKITEYKTLTFLDLNYEFSSSTDKTELLCWDICKCENVHRNVLFKRKKFENSFYLSFIPEINRVVPRNTLLLLDKKKNILVF